MKFQELNEIGGGGLISGKYKGSPSHLLSQVYPDYDWLPWKFGTSPHYFWDDLKNQRKFLEWAAKELNIKEMSDWYKITMKVTIETTALEISGIATSWWI
jgi:hypothetical protein